MLHPTSDARQLNCIKINVDLDFEKINKVSNSISKNKVWNIWQLYELNCSCKWTKSLETIKMLMQSMLLKTELRTPYYSLIHVLNSHWLARRPIFLDQRWTATSIWNTSYVFWPAYLATAAYIEKISDDYSYHGLCITVVLRWGK